MSRVIRSVPPEAARELASEAKTEAAAILARAESDAERIRKEAEEIGLRQGLAQAAALCRELERQRGELLTRSEVLIFEVALAAAEKIIGQIVREDRERSVHVVHAAISRVVGASDIVVCVHPEDVAAIAQAFPQARVLPDAALRQGGCVLRCSQGSVDARIETQLQHLAEALCGGKT